MKDIVRSNCQFYGEPPVYPAETRCHTCDVCCNDFQSEASCEQGHFICNPGRSTTANELIEASCIKSGSVKPVEPAVELMNALSISMHEPEHHFLVPAVLLTANYNQKAKAREKESKIKVARQRADNVLGGGYGFYGGCGAGIGSGIFISLIADSIPLSTETWGLANPMNAEGLRFGALGRPRCCKRNTFLALKTAKRILAQKMDGAPDSPGTLHCEFADFKKECIEEDCPFHAKEKV